MVNVIANDFLARHIDPYVETASERVNKTTVCSGTILLDILNDFGLVSDII